MRSTTILALNTGRAGQKIRLAAGLSKYGNREGPLHDNNDWKFADDGLLLFLI